MNLRLTNVGGATPTPNVISFTARLKINGQAISESIGTSFCVGGICSTNDFFVVETQQIVSALWNK